MIADAHAAGAWSLATMLTTASVLAFLALAVFAGARDVATYVIPNWIPLAIVAAFAVAALAHGLSPAAAAWHVLGAVTVFTVGAILFHYRVMGGGDVKLMAAAALWTGLAGALMLVVLVSLYGGLLTLGVLALRRLRRGRSGDAAAKGVPYGAAIAAGVVTIVVKFPSAAGGLLNAVALGAAGAGG